MHRSAYKFGISLMASLIVLSALAIPMSNMNLFSDAMASGKHSDKNENSQEYESYYSYNDDKYRANYDDNSYYQQESQPSYSNNYGYSDDKKISYNNSYDNDNSKYSKYPTKDKKYVCQTGQFQGFFVESVEFCKLKIAQGPTGPQGHTGPQGPTGPQGLTGPQGPQGPSSVPQINSTNLYLTLGNIANNTEVSSATCNGT